jgi:cobalt/nickel transport system permease protein
MAEETTNGTLDLLAAFDPRLKVVAVAGFSVLTAVLEKKTGLVLALVLSLVMAVHSGISSKETLKRLAPVNTMVLFFWMLLPFSMKGETVFHLLNIAASSEGINLALRVTMKANESVEKPNFQMNFISPRYG